MSQHKYNERTYRGMATFFKALASTDLETAVHLAVIAAMMFKEDNPSFDTSSFGKGCGLAVKGDKYVVPPR